MRRTWASNWRQRARSRSLSVRCRVASCFNSRTRARARRRTSSALSSASRVACSADDSRCFRADTALVEPAPAELPLRAAASSACCSASRSRLCSSAFSRSTLPVYSREGEGSQHRTRHDARAQPPALRRCQPHLLLRVSLEPVVCGGEVGQLSLQRGGRLWGRASPASRALRLSSRRAGAPIALYLLQWGHRAVREAGPAASALAPRTARRRRTVR